MHMHIQKLHIQRAIVHRQYRSGLDVVLAARDMCEAIESQRCAFWTVRTMIAREVNYSHTNGRSSSQIIGQELVTAIFHRVLNVDVLGIIQGVRLRLSDVLFDVIR
jgi:hypothetical protein